jgi:hypothetical protein
MILVAQRRVRLEADGREGCGEASGYCPTADYILIQIMFSRRMLF